jgi:hypothetical protein
MKYIRGTRDLILRLSADGNGILKWWIDASFAVHPNMRGHSGGGLSLGRGFPITSSTKQKLNTRSSTETEIVGVDDFMPAVCWTRYFMEAQGYNVADNVVAQDNKASMLLENNGKASSSKRTKHINIRYFFITDRIAKGEVKVEWCPTQEMVGDYMTKPLQGGLFRKFRDLIMGVHPAESANATKSKKLGLTPSKSKERRHRSVLEQTANPAKLINDPAKIPAKTCLKVHKRKAHNGSQKNRQLNHGTWKPVKATPKREEKKRA